MNFDCATWRIQDELWEMTANQREEQDGYSLCYPLNQRSQNTISARRKMWGEDGNDARRIKLPQYY
jgi:hypothetical protein